MDSMDTDSSESTRTVLDYYKDKLMCFVPFCKKYRRDFRDSAFMCIPKSLQATWCQTLDINCPKRSLYVCEDHINIEEDCYKSKSGKLHLKKTANLKLTRTYYENEMLIDDSLNNEEGMSTMPTAMKCDKSTHTEINFATKAVLAKPSVRSVSVSANIKETYTAEKIMPSHPSSSTASRSSTPSLYYKPSSPSTSSTNKDTTLERKDMSGRTYILKVIKENPKMYLGVPKSFYWLIDFMTKQCKLRFLYVIITLFKLKQNDSLQRLAHHFQLSRVMVQDVLKISIPHLATYLQMHIFLPEPIAIKRTLPPVFKVRYANVQCLIDCFEIQIEKPSDPVKQSESWSQYKSGNTLKYLIASCPNGFVCYVSKGFGGRISDKALTERSGFVEILPPGAVVLADRGFKGIETLLAERHVKLLRPPSVSSTETPTKKDVIQTKIIASLRIHVERVIRRVREFSFLKPHSVINHNHVKFADEAVIIACGLVNLQNNIIKIQ